MLFTVSEMEMLCMFHAETRTATITLMQKAAAEMLGRRTGRLADVQSAIEKLERMREGEHACIGFDAEK